MVNKTITEQPSITLTEQQPSRAVAVVPQEQQKITVTPHIYEHEQFGKIRVIGDADDPRFCLSDACKMLGIGNPSDVKKRLDDGVVSIEGIPDSMGRQQNVTFVNEDGLYDLILDSRKPEAKRIRKWITGEVMPSLRKKGYYAVKPMTPLEILEQQVAVMKSLDLEQKRQALVQREQGARLSAIEGHAQRLYDEVDCNISTLHDHEDRIGMLEGDRNRFELMHKIQGGNLNLLAIRTSGRISEVEDKATDLHNKYYSILKEKRDISEDINVTVRRRAQRHPDYTSLSDGQRYKQAYLDFYRQVEIEAHKTKGYIQSLVTRNRNRLMANGISETKAKATASKISVVNDIPELKEAATVVLARWVDEMEEIDENI